MRKILPILLLALLGTTMAGCKFIVNQLAFFPDPVDRLSKPRLPPGVEERFIDTADGVRIQLLYLPTPDSARVLLYFHGNAGNIYHRVSDLLQFQRFGINVVGVSYRGYGKSEGSPSEEGIYQDGEAVFNYVTRELGFAPDNIIMFGRSIGTTVAINSAKNRVIGGLILVTPLTSGKAHAKAVGLGLISSLAGDAFDNLSKIKDIKAPLLVIHGTDDRIIPFAMGRQLFDSAQTQKQFIKIAGGGHNNLQANYRQVYWPAISGFIQQLSN
ncbi:MAG: alpha/beta hydrolase [Candidatus Polarisedimenticolaceae bacterium]|nr:alpha/beta hydrolase [Candidatus Polarisedimenticolaceae bacterium]